jgi:hypothetical protein
MLIPGDASSIRMIIAEIPPMSRTARSVTPYWMPMTLWSTVNWKYRRQV